MEDIQFNRLFKMDYYNELLLLNLSDFKHLG